MNKFKPFNQKPARYITDQFYLYHNEIRHCSRTSDASLLQYGSQAKMQVKIQATGFQIHKLPYLYAVRPQKLLDTR